MNTTTQVVVLAVMAALAAPFLTRAIRAALSDPGRFPKAAWGAPEACFTAVLVGFFLWMALASSEGEPTRVDIRSIATSMVLYATLAILVLSFLIVRGVNPVTAFGLQWPGAAREWPVVPTTLALSFPFIYLLQWAAYQLAGPEAQAQPIVTFLLDHAGWADRLAVAAVALVAAPVTEEMIFRGCVYGISRQFAGRWPAMVFTAVVFALIHGHIPSLPGLMVLSLALTLVYERTGSLWAPIGVHASFNALTVAAAIVWPDLAK